MTKQEDALRREIAKFLQGKGFRSISSPAIDLIMEWEVTMHGIEEPQPDVVTRRKGKS